MIDTIFFLLVFFMITSLSMVRMKALPIALPRSAAGSAGGQATDPRHLTVLTVSDTGGYYVGERSVDPAGLAAMLAARASTDPETVIVLNVAKSQTAQTLITVMDVVNRVRTSDGRPVKALMATEPIDKTGHALPGGVR